MSSAKLFEDDDSCDRITRSVIPENISGVESLIGKGPKLAVAEIQDIKKISSAVLTRILYDCLGPRKRCAPWVAYNLSEEQKWGRRTGAAIC